MFWEFLRTLVHGHSMDSGVAVIDRPSHTENPTILDQSLVYRLPQWHIRSAIRPAGERTAEPLFPWLRGSLVDPRLRHVDLPYHP